MPAFENILPIISSLVFSDRDIAWQKYWNNCNSRVVAGEPRKAWTIFKIFFQLFRVCHTEYQMLVYFSLLKYCFLKNACNNFSIFSITSIAARLSTTTQPSSCSYSVFKRKKKGAHTNQISFPQKTDTTDGHTCTVIAWENASTSSRQKKIQVEKWTKSSTHNQKATCNRDLLKEGKSVFFSVKWHWIY